MSSLTGLLIRRRGGSLAIQIKPRRPLSTLTATPPPAIVPPKGVVPAFVSRRQWNKLYKAPPRKAPPKDDLSDKPWPRSVQLLGYGLATTVVPYCIAWFVASNVTLREILDPKFPWLLPALRPWFGHEELDAVSYVDRRAEGDALEIPRQLDNEDTTKVRKEQAEVMALDQETAIPVRIRVFAHNGFNLGEILHLPGATRMTEEQLLQIVMQDRNMSLDMESVSHITVDFTNEEGEESPISGDNNTEDTAMLTVHVPETSALLRQDIAKMLKTTSIFSSWHVFPEIVQQQQQQQKQSTTSKSSTSSSSSSDDLRISQLEYEIDQLEKQLKDHTTMRSFDDIQQEISTAKSELSRLKWRKRLRWFG